MPYKDPERQREYKPEWQRDRRLGTRGTERCGTGGTEASTLTSAEDVRRVLEEQINALRSAPKVRPVERARAIATLAALCLRAIDASVQEERLEALEAALQKTRGAS